MRSLLRVWSGPRRCSKYARFYLTPIRYDAQVVRFYEKLADRLAASTGAERVLEDVLESLFKPDYVARANFLAVRGAPLQGASKESLERLVDFGERILAHEDTYPTRAVQHVREGLPAIRRRLPAIREPGV